MEVSVQNPIHFTHDMLLSFLDHLRDLERSDATIQKYYAELKSFYNYLPDDKMITSVSLSNWRAFLIDAEFAARTINTRIAACNSFLSYLNRKDWQVSPIALADESTTDPITREEYHKLLKAARKANKEWLYFLIKTFCCLGLSASELPLFTVDSLVTGNITIASKSRTRIVYIPENLKEEFLKYTLRAKINAGSVFKSPIGEPLSRSYIVSELQSLCVDAGISSEKGTPKCLQELYNKTHSDIRSEYFSLINKEYARILEKEDTVINWETSAV